jgi:hypothetical protein
LPVLAQPAKTKAETVIANNAPLPIFVEIVI